MSTETKSIQSNTVLEFKIDFNTAKLFESLNAFSSPDDCKPLKANIVRGLMTSEGAYKRVTAPKSGSVTFATLGLKHEDNYRKRVFTDNVATEVSGIAPPIKLNSDETVTTLPPIERATAFRAFMSTGDGRGYMEEYWVPDPDSDGEIRIILAKPIDIPADDDHSLLPACMIETIDETKLKKQPQNQK